MRLRASALLAVVLTSVVAAAAPKAIGDQVIVRDSHVCRIYALRGTLVYERARSGWAEGCAQAPMRRGWMRIVNGRARSVHGVLRKAFAAGSIGVDERGRVVLTVPTAGDDVSQTPWWIYDVGSDSARRVRVSAPADCAIRSLAIWRTRLVYTRDMCADWEQSGHFLRIGSHTRRLVSHSSWNVWNQGSHLVIRGTTVAGWGYDDGDDGSVGRLSQGDHSCPTFYGYGDVNGVTPHGVWLAGNRMVWLNSSQELDPNGVLVGTLWSVAMPGLCEPLGQPAKLYEIPTELRAQAIAIDAPYLYYADSSAIHRHRLAGL